MNFEPPQTIECVHCQQIFIVKRRDQLPPWHVNCTFCGYAYDIDAADDPLPYMIQPIGQRSATSLSYGITHPIIEPIPVEPIPAHILEVLQDCQREILKIMGDWVFERVSRNDWHRR